MAWPFGQSWHVSFRDEPHRCRTCWERKCCNENENMMSLGKLFWLRAAAFQGMQRWKHKLGRQGTLASWEGWCLKRRTWPNEFKIRALFFPTCQVRVVRFYVSLFSSSSSRTPPPPSSSSSCRDPVSSVWRAGPQLWSREFSVACRTSTAILRVQCGVPDPNCDHASSVWRTGPQPRAREFSVACRTSTASSWGQCGVPDLKYCVRKFVRKNDRRYVRKNVRRYVRRNVKKICQKICQKECQKICQKDVRKNVRRYVRKNVKRYVRKNGKRYVRKNVRR